MNTKEYIGFNSIKHLKKFFPHSEPKKVFLVRDKKSFTLCGAETALSSLLASCPKVFHFSDFNENPRLEDVEKGINLYKQELYDLVIAVGGGSVIDMAKLINIFSAQDGAIGDYLDHQKEILEPGKPVIAIPTTAGTGSEATHFAVVYRDHVKYSVAHPYILPNVAIVDPQFTMSLPSYLTASSGMDALCQAIESYWCINSNTISKGYARRAIRLILRYLVEAVHQPTKRARVAMAEAAYLAGKAINITKTTAPHAISYPFTSFFNVNHGHAVSLTLGEVLFYNSQVSEADLVDKRGVNYVQRTITEINKLFKCKNSIETKERIAILMKDIGLSSHLEDLGVKSEADFQLIVSNINLERLNNNPRILNEQALKNILQNIH